MAAAIASEEILMRTAKLAIGALATAALLGAPHVEAKPGGCLKYGVAGAVAGHYAGHHAVKGAVAGCIAGMVRRHEYKKQMEREKEDADKQKQIEEQNRAVTGAPAAESTTPAGTPPSAANPATTSPAAPASQ